MKYAIGAFLSIFVFVGLAILGFGLWTILDATSASDWPVVKGKVLRSEFVIEREDANNFVTTPNVVYSYRVGKNSYESDVLAKGIGSSYSPGESRRWVNDYSVGKTIDVFVDPDEPTEAVLKPGIPLEAWFLVAFGAVFTSAPVIIGFVAMRSIRRMQFSESDIDHASVRGNKPTIGYVVAAGFFGIFLIVGLVILSIAISKRQVEADSTSWPTVRGEVIYSGVRHETKSGENGTEHSYYPRVVYNYSIDNTTYTAQGISLSDAGTSRQRDAAKAIKPYPKGTPVDVYYDPSDHYQAALKTGSSSGSLIFLIVGGVFTAVGGFPIIGFTIAKVWKSLNLGTTEPVTADQEAYDPFRATEAEDPFDAPWDRKQ
jgi:hypothetical protein